MVSGSTQLRDVFKDPFAVEWLDNRASYGEDRFIILGMVEDRLLYVVHYAWRSDLHHFGPRSRTL